MLTPKLSRQCHSSSGYRRLALPGREQPRYRRAQQQFLPVQQRHGPPAHRNRALAFGQRRKRAVGGPQPDPDERNVAEAMARREAGRTRRRSSGRLGSRLKSPRWERRCFCPQAAAREGSSASIMVAALLQEEHGGGDRRDDYSVTKGRSPSTSAQSCRSSSISDLIQ
jgi:hypothetical protein